MVVGWLGLGDLEGLSNLNDSMIPPRREDKIQAGKGKFNLQSNCIHSYVYNANSSLQKKLSLFIDIIKLAWKKV